jgi:hypothetical protein
MMSSAVEALARMPSSSCQGAFAGSPATLEEVATEREPLAKEEEEEEVAECVVRYGEGARAAMSWPAILR